MTTRSGVPLWAPPESLFLLLLHGVVGGARKGTLLRAIPALIVPAVQANSPAYIQLGFSERASSRVATWCESDTSRCSRDDSRTARVTSSVPMAQRPSLFGGVPDRMAR